jgi:ATP-dependent Lon protease
LDKIKRRLIEYLAVVRLKELNAARETSIIGEANGLNEKPRNMKAIKDGRVVDTAEQGKGGAVAKYKSGEKTEKPDKRTRKKGVKGPILLYVDRNYLLIEPTLIYVP